MSTDAILIRFSPEVIYLYEIESGNFHKTEKYTDVTDYRYIFDMKSHKRAIDLSNFVNIRSIYKLKNTTEADERIDELVSRYHLGELSVLESPVKYSGEAAVQGPALPTAYMDFFLKKWHSGCIPFYSNEEIDKGNSIVEQFRYSVPSYGELIDYESIGEAISRLVQRQNKLFPCEEGVQSLYVSGEGKLFRCNAYYQAGLEKPIAELGCIESVDDVIPCKSCFARYMCGGRCNLLVDQLQADACDLFREWMIIILKAVIAHQSKSVKTLVKGH
ncbi:hypothetical protein V3851_12395 [Paenibacillus sp. M1]|uniref:SPASM domain-containing protein n=1 Tax=Paenibacillus haidiansis TaxID=1574488 RepID=A0ABU7VTR0_9BACL